MESLLAGKPVDRHGRPIPWMCYPVVSLLEQRLHGDLQVFEYGSGYSTYFYAERAKAVVSLECDRAWFDRIGPTLPSNVTLLFKDADTDGEYCRAIHSVGRPFDVVIVDGQDRVNCLKQAAIALTERGVILLDDSQREAYEEGLQHLRGIGFRLLDFEGMKANGLGVYKTTLCYRQGNCLGI
jgi:hypothetical protein